MSIKVGIIEVDLKEGYAKVVQWGKRHKTRHSLKKLTNKNTKRSIGGVSSSEMNTPYKSTIKKIKSFLKYRGRVGYKNGWATVDEILEEVETHYTTPKPSVMATLQENWNSNWIETKKENGKRYFRFRKDEEV